MGGIHGYLSLVLSEAKMCLVTGDSTLDCDRTTTPERINPAITDTTSGRALLQIQEEQKLEWQEFTLQTVIDAVGVESIVIAVKNQYVKELSEDYIGYKNQTIAAMVKQLQTWYVITNKEKLNVKALFQYPWSYTPNYHITTLSRQLKRR